MKWLIISQDNLMLLSRRIAGCHLYLRWARLINVTIHAQGNGVYCTFILGLISERIKSQSLNMPTLKSTEHSQFILSVFLDIKKAFNDVNATKKTGTLLAVPFVTEYVINIALPRYICVHQDEETTADCGVSKSCEK